MRVLKIAVILTLIILISCKSNKNKQSSVRRLDSVQNIELSETTENTDYLLPTPDEVMEEIFTNKLNFQFDERLLNKSNNIYYYLDTKKQALNLGVYLADLAYINMTDNKNNTIEYFKVVRELSQKLNIYSLLDKSLYDRIQQNLANKDSLNDIFTAVYYDISEMLAQTSRNGVSIMISSGALIETFYIAVNSIQDYNEFKPVVTKIFEQKSLLENFYASALPYSNDANVSETMKLIEKLKTILENSTISKEKVLTEKRSNKFIIKGGDNYLTTEDEYNKFKDQVLHIRKDITGIN